MKNIKAIYWVLSSIFFLITIALAIYTLSINGDWASLTLSGIAIVIALIAIGVSDKNLPVFQGKVKCWTDNPQIKEALKKQDGEKEEDDDDEKDCKTQHKISFHIENDSDTPINNIKIKIRTPHKITSFYQEKNQGLRLRKHTFTYIFFDDSYGILGSVSNNDYIHYDICASLEEWKVTMGDIYITINGTNIQTSTFTLKFKDITSLKQANKDTPISLQKLKI